MRSYHDIAYLLDGDEKQKEVYAVLQQSRILKFLYAFDPVLAGTYPIGIYLPESDIDIICQYNKPEHFISVLKNAFSGLEGFHIKTKSIREIESIIARFRFAGFKFEVFGQPIPVKEQYAYRHMLIEDNILSAQGAYFRIEVLTLKEKGLSTEEAFAFLLGIEGDPYDGLLEYSIET